MTKTGKSHTHWTSFGRLLGGSAPVGLSVCHGRPLSLLDSGVLLNLGSDPPLGIAESQLLSVDRLALGPRQHLLGGCSILSGDGEEEEGEKEEESSSGKFQ